jgi:hypothetical protein
MPDLRPRLTKSITQIQREVECDSYSWVWRVLAGKEQPSVALAKRLEAATDGAIRWTEFFAEPVHEEAS